MSTHAIQKVTAASLSLLALLGAPLATPAFSESFHTLASLPPIAVGFVEPILSGLTIDPQGRLYGTSAGGGAFSHGYVYRLTPGASKSDPWTFETLRDFHEASGGTPWGSLTIGSRGELYGTTTKGGRFDGGIAFRLDNTPGWPLTTLHNFGAKDDGSDPRGSLVFGAQGLLYGTTFTGGEFAGGTVFSLSSNGDGVSYAVLNNFPRVPGPDGGFYPNDDLVVAPDGDLYGTTNAGGLTAQSAGVFFKLARNEAGSWHYASLHDFVLFQGDFYPASPVRAADGSFYGCSMNGVYNGSIYALTPPRPGVQGWQASTVKVFPARNGGLATTPCQAVAVNPAGGLIATDKPFNTASGQPGGEILQVLPPATAGGVWRTKTLHVFHPTSAEPYYPMSSLLRHGGLYYGVTILGFPANGGMTYDLRP